jgi:hypothetical protein
VGRLSSGLIAVILCSVPAAAPAQPSERDEAKARELVNRAIALQAKHDIDGAVALYRQAYCLIPEPALVYNIGTAYQVGDRPADAMSYFKLYLKVAPTGELAADTKTAMKALTPHVPTDQGEPAVIKCQTAPEPTPICVNGAKPVDGVCPVLASPPCPDGEELQDGTCVARILGGAGDAGGDRKQPGQNRTLLYAGVATAGAGAVALGFGIMFGIKAKDASDALSNNDMGWTQELLDQEKAGKDAERNQIIFTVVGGTAVVGGVVMVVLGLRTGSSESSAAARLVPWFSGGDAGVALTGRY